MKDKHSISGKVILSLAIIMIAFLCIGINAEAAKKQKLVAKKYTLIVGESTKLTYKNTPKKFKKAKTKWTITSGKKNAKIKVAKNKKSATLVATKAGTVKVKLAYKGKKVGIVKFVIKTKKKTNNKTEDITETEDNSNDTNDSKNETTTEATTEATTESSSTPYVRKYSYEVYPVHPEYTVYNKGEYYYFLKTDNPDLQSLLRDEDGKYVYLYEGSMVADIAYGDNTVKGGYIFSIKNPKADANGNYSFNLYEIDKDAFSDPKKDKENIANPALCTKVLTFSVKVSDYDTAYEALLTKITNEVKEGWEANTEDKVKNDNYADGYRPIPEVERKMLYAQIVCKQYIGNAYCVNLSSMAATSTTRESSTVLNDEGLSCAGGSKLIAEIAKRLGYTNVATDVAKINQNSKNAHIDVVVTVDGVEYEVSSGYGGCGYSKTVIDSMQFNPANINTTDCIAKSE